MDQAIFFKGCPPQLLLGPFLNTLSQMALRFVVCQNSICFNCKLIPLQESFMLWVTYIIFYIFLINLKIRLKFEVFSRLVAKTFFRGGVGVRKFLCQPPIKISPM